MFVTWSYAIHAAFSCVRLVEVKLKQIPQEFALRKYKLHSREGTSIIVGGLLFVVLVLFYTISQLQSKRSKTTAGLNINRSSKLKGNDCFSKPEAPCSRKGNCEKNRDVIYVENKLSTEEFDSESRKYTAAALKELYVNEEFRSLIKKRKSTPSSFNWQTRRSLGIKM